MHIAIVTGGYYGLSGSFTNARELAIHLAGKGHIVTILSPDVAPEQNNKHMYFIRIQDIPLIPQNIFYFSSLLQVHRQHPIDIIQVYDSIAFLSVYPFAQYYSIPTVFSMQASIFSEGRSVDYSWLTAQILKFTNRFVARFADRLICISQEVVCCAIHAGAKKDRLVVITNPVDLSTFHPANEVKDNYTCLYVGALRPTKGVEYLIHAIPHVLKQLPETRFLLVGDGPQKEEIERFIAEYEIDEAVHLEGYIPHDKLPLYYQRAHIFIMPSLNEPQGIVTLEAMACGLPVIASNVGGIPEMVQDGHNGLLVPPKNSEALGKAIVRLIGDASLCKRLSQNALLTAKAFSWDENIGSFIRLFSCLTKAK
ncbi:MAG: glycosyltransferase family 4 protein [Thermodesulfobacteriota bacterium]|nr:glycosyltransferase family 4 protein [Thermodesulfobacteriota bacterium]